MKTLLEKIKKISGKGYPLYKTLKGRYDYNNRFNLDIKRVQGDPFASPSRIVMEIECDNLKIPSDFYKDTISKLGLTNYYAREFSKLCKKFSHSAGSGKSGLLYIDSPEQKILQISSVYIENKKIFFDFYLGLPAFGRKINGDGALKIFSDIIPQIYKSLTINIEKANHFITICRNGEIIRKYLKENEYIAFIGENSILPREAGNSERPMKNAIPFKSPDSLKITIPLKNGEKIDGMGLKKGITIITGGGFHGKSTLLKAIESGIYYHIPGDGREYVITQKDAVKVRAEDGRAISGTDISPFIKNLPDKKETTSFFTSNASGSTSQAANISEAIEANSHLILMDEDTCATNFMVKDERMSYLIEDEPITPFTAILDTLKEKYSLSFILVIGGMGNYLDHADTILLMKDYSAYDITKRKDEIKKLFPLKKESKKVSAEIKNKKILTSSFLPPHGKFKIKTDGKDAILYGRDEINLRNWEMFFYKSQLKLGGDFLYALSKYNKKEITSDDVEKIVSEYIEKGEFKKFANIFSLSHSNNWMEIRTQDIMAIINRYRKLKVNN